MKDSIPVVEFILDTLFDVNGDNAKDLLVNGQFRNGRCTPMYAMLFCFDSASYMFTHIEVVEKIPNPEFLPSAKLIKGSTDCMMSEDRYQFKWEGLKLDTIFITTKLLN